MADNTTLPGTGTVIATDDVSGVFFQKIKLDAGGDGASAPVTGNVGLPVVGVTPTVGPTNITTQNLVPAGTATANSAVVLATQDAASMNIQVTGTYTGALSLQGTVNGTTWVTIGGGSTFLNLNSGAYSATIASASQGIWMVDVGGFAAVRVTGLAAMTGTAAVTLLGQASASVVALDNSLPAGAAVIGGVTQSGTWNVGTVTAVSAMTPAAPTTTNHAISSAASTNATAVKTSAGTLYNIVASNTGAAVAFVKLYNKASAPTVGTDVPVLTIPVPAGGTVALPMGAMGQRFATGIAMAITNLAADSDTTAVAAAQVKVLTSYI